MDLTRNKIAITGLGLVGPFGTSAEALWDAQTPNGTTFGTCSRYDNGLPAAEAEKVDLRKMLKSGQLSRAPLISQYAVAASHMALTQAGIVQERGAKTDRIGIVFGTSNGPGAATQQIYDDLIDAGPSAVKPRVFQESVFNAPASLVSIHFGFSGPIQVVPGVGFSALYQAQMMLAQPDVDVVLALCSEELCEGIQSGLHALRWHAGFDGDGGVTRGAVMSEGAVAMVLERAEDAALRGATPLAELAGVGIANDAAELGRPAPDGRGLVVAMQEALADGQALTADIDLVLTGSAGTSVDDRLEGAALDTVFDGTVPPSGSSKRSTGFAMGSAPITEVALGVCAVMRAKAPASVPDCQGKVNAVLCNAIGLNGQFGTTLIRSANV